MTTGIELFAVVAASALGAAVNSIAGGGTLLTFPALVGLGIPPLTANATSCLALWPGAASSLWGYRDELRGARAWVWGFTAPSLLGGAVGGWLLLRVGHEGFARLVPWLVLGATGLFAVQARWTEAVRRGREAQAPPLYPRAVHLLLQGLVGVYGGFFGAGVGILMLGVLGLMGETRIHRMNGLKNWGGLCMNGVAAATFAWNGLVDWPVAGAMAVGALLGGYGASRGIQRVPVNRVRQAVLVIGFASAAWMFTR